MKRDKVKQVICITDPDPVMFEEKMNEALSKLVDPDVRIFESMPFTAVIMYSVSRELPESVLELLELADGEHHVCEECPYYIKPQDRRVKWGACRVQGTKTRGDSRACESYYLYRYKVLAEAKERYLESPFIAE